MSWDPIWEKVFQNHAWGKYPDESFIRFVARNFYGGDRPKTRILEIGCGPGANIWYLSREGFSTSGIDGSATAIDNARKRLSLEGLSADLHVGDIGRLPFADGAFDAVADNECLAHNDSASLGKIIQEVRRVLKSGGLFYSRTFTSNVYKGKQFRTAGELEFADSSDGPFAGRGFFRLSTRESISEHYARHFEILSLDRLEYTLSNESQTVSEWIIVCRKP